MQCEICGKQFSNLTTKELHLMKHFREGAEEGFIPSYRKDKFGNEVLVGLVPNYN